MTFKIPTFFKGFVKSSPKVNPEGNNVHKRSSSPGKPLSETQNRIHERGVQLNNTVDSTNNLLKNCKKLAESAKSLREENAKPADTTPKSPSGHSRNVEITNNKPSTSPSSYTPEDPTHLLNGVMGGRTPPATSSHSSFSGKTVEERNDAIKQAYNRLLNLANNITPTPPQENLIDDLNASASSCFEKYTPKPSLWQRFLNLKPINWLVKFFSFGWCFRT